MELIADLVVSSEHLTQLSTRMSNWKTDHADPAVAAVPIDWSTLGIAGLATGGAVSVGLGGAAAVTGFVGRAFSVKGISFTGEQAIAVAVLAATGYSIYGALSAGDYWSASLNIISVLPQGIGFYMLRSGMRKRLLEGGGGIPHILEKANLCLNGVFFCFGLGNDPGDVFRDGARQFGNGNAALRQLMPGTEWTGTASVAYAEAVQELQALTSEMAAADTQIANILEAEMDQLGLTRNLIDTAMRTIEVAIPIAVALYTASPAGPKASEAFQVAVAFSAVSTAVGAMANQLRLSAVNGQRIAAQTAKYVEAQAKAAQLLTKLSAPT